MTWLFLFWACLVCVKLTDTDATKACFPRGCDPID